ncbi:hypothetical protein Cgig2_018051 [Carnegiea gigantea]|uniref:Uncharacterized protein n=1 Tax=Carnegiea gigantea TaxID=171969 RepID=A0A9Q1GUX9_9CARY|nr:hypothetical protein Cgig2_018051 [Carnegiea gigantea]
MAQNPYKNHKQKPSNPIVIPHSRSISTIPAHQNISFMPKFLLKLLQKKKHGHKRSISIVKADSSHKDLGVGKGGSVDQISMIDKHVHGNNRNNYLLQLLPVPKRVSSIMSNLTKNTHKSRDYRSNDHKTAKTIKSGSSSSSVSSLCVKGKSGKNQLLCRSSDPDELCDSGVGVGHSVNVVNRGKISRAKSGKMKAIRGKKEGLKMKGFIKIKRKGKEEPRFELCKKKILMGEKCRPLNGCLHYDKNGILLKCIALYKTCAAVFLNRYIVTPKDEVQAYFTT